MLQAAGNASNAIEQSDSTETDGASAIGRQRRTARMSCRSGRYSQTHYIYFLPLQQFCYH